ncbi:MAG: hypothetical protein PHV32_11735 [Eubacteriales bacterium]|nr:hypothetical protein [Eubacteriales bacterium]
MKKRIVRYLSCLIFLCAVLSALQLSASALEWDGSSSGGGGGGSPAGPNGYAVRTTGDNCLGYRFSLVDKYGNNKVSKVIDVFRNTSYGNMEYSSAYKFTVKYNKKQLINNQNSGFSTSKNTTNCYKEANMGFVTSLPTPNGLSAWQNYTSNLNAVLSVLNAGNINSLKNGDKILVEPLYDVRLQGTYHSVTTTELAIYGKYILGAYSDGGSSSTSASWGFISSYTNKYYPNSLYTPDGQGLWNGVGALSGRAIFYTIINSGYCVGIAYTETKPDFTPNLSVYCCEAWPGSVSSRNNNHYGISYGSTFANYTYGHGYPIVGDKVWYAIHFPAESENCYVRQTVWVNGGGSTSRNVWSNSNTWYDVALWPTQVDQGRSSYVIKARVDWIDSSGNVLKWGAEKTFYIPIRPKINRYQVSMYSITGALSAYNSSGGSSGAVYAGQRTYPKYTYTSDNSWWSYNNFTGSLYKLSGSSWVVANGSADVSVTGAALNSNNPYNRYSSLGLYTVPKESSRIPIYLMSAWSSDTAHTSESTWIDIPVYTPDVELAEIRLVDKDGYYLDPMTLEAGETVTVQYVYKNNTACTVYVNGYNSDRSQINGIYSIPSGGTIYVNGYTFSVPNERTLYIWGGVYLEGVGIYNTGYEANGTNNTKTLTCKVNLPLRLSPIEPNADYREGTDVITCYWLTNRYSDDYTQNDSVTVRFRICNSSGTLITTTTKTQAVVPGNDKNLVYFKWRVPSGLNYSDIIMHADVIQYGISYNLISKSYSTCPYTYSATPDTQFEGSAPDGFSIPSEPAGKSGYAIWWEYDCTDGAFTKRYYGIGIYNGGTTSITPATGATAVLTGDSWTMKSGYGVSLKAYNALLPVFGLRIPSSLAYTSVQYAYAVFPEYEYLSLYGRYRTLEKSGSYWYFRQNGNYGNIHFTPLWYPDGSYTVKVFKSDCWTPSGMITAASVTNTITISGSAYDDWYVGR